MQVKKNSLYWLLLVGLSSVAGSWTHAAENERPNIVVIISDDQGYHDYGFMRHPVIQTTHLDRLAGESLLFTRGYVTTALCSPSLATMLTGLYPHQHGWTGNDPAREVGGWGSRQGWIDRFSKNPQLPALLREAGYLTLHTGKYWQGDPLEVSGFTHGMGKTLRHGSPESLGIGRDGLQPIYDFIAGAREQKKPFMVWYAPFLPHTPHTPPERLLKKYADQVEDVKVARYYAMVEWLDETCGELMKHLDEQGLRENTLVMYIVDNGWGQGAPGYRGNKQTPWEQGVRTPVMIRWPGHVTPRRDELHLASNLDIPVTALSAAGIPVPETMEGLNLLDDRAVNGRDTLFIEDFSHDMKSPDRPESTLEARGVIHDWWKLVEMYEPGDGDARVRSDYLFNLADDPKEERNLAGQDPAMVVQLRQKLDAWWNPQIPFEAAEKGGEPVTKTFVYRSVDKVDLKMKFWYPPGWTPGGPKLPAVVFFFGGGWHGGDIRQFDSVAPYLAGRGMIVITPEYRTGRQGVQPDTCLKDARHAMRFIRARVDEFGIDEKRLAAGGRSAGGHLAAAVGFSRGFDAEGDDPNLPAGADALVLFNPVIDNGPGGFRHDAVKAYWQDFSPLHTVHANPPPTLFLTGDKDQYTPIETAIRYKEEMERQEGRCDLVVFEGGVHGSPFNQAFFPTTLKSMDEFLVDLGYLDPRDE